MSVLVGVDKMEDVTIPLHSVRHMFNSGLKTKISIPLCIILQLQNASVKQKKF